MTNTFLQTALLRAQSKKGKKNGFTLIELMVVVAIVGVLTAVGLPQMTQAQGRAKDSAAKATLTNAAKECSLSLITFGDATEYADADGPINANFADVDGTCEITTAGTELTLESDTGKEFTVKFDGAIPGTVTEKV